jgi:hypothetical protein
MVCYKERENKKQKPKPKKNLELNRVELVFKSFRNLNKKQIPL